MKQMPWSGKRTSLGLVHLSPQDTSAPGILSAIAVASLSASMSPSWTALRSLAERGDPTATAEADRGLWVVFGFSTLASAALLLAFKSWLPALLSELAAASMFGVGMWGLHGGTPALPQAKAQALPQAYGAVGPVAK